MTVAPPIRFRWTGEAMVPASSYQARLSDRAYVLGEVYTLVEQEVRSSAQHRWFFAAVHEAWASLPEHLAELYPTAEHLRKRALIEAGYYEEQIVDAGSEAAAERVASIFTRREEFSLAVVRGPLVVIRSPRSQSPRSMPKGEFKDSVDKVMEIVAAMVGVDVATLAASGERPAA